MSKYTEQVKIDDKRTSHLSDCSMHNEPAYPKGLCDCGAYIERNYSFTVKDDARKAADLIRSGWHQGMPTPVMWGRDMDTAIVDACSSYVGILNLMNAVVNEIGHMDISWWNDRKGRTKEEVLAVFDRIANS